VREVKLLETTQIRLFPPDTIPFVKLVLDKNRKVIHSLFSFEGVEPISREGSIVGINFTAGSYGPRSILIPSVAIEERRIVVKVQGTSEEATSLYEEVRKKLEDLNENRPIRETLCTHETVCSVVLDAAFERVFSQSFLQFIKQTATKYTKNPWSENYIVPADLKFTVRYKVIDDSLVRNHIALASKELVIEPRTQSAIEDQLYWIKSPTDTDTHFKLIDDLERALSEK
jgi:hypothetical protein